MRVRARLDANHREIVNALRDEGAKVLSLAELGNGCPDLLVWHENTGLVLVEVKDGAKSPSRRALTPDQERFFDEWSDAPIHVVASTEDVLLMILWPESKCTTL